MKEYNSITEILDTITTDKDGVRRTFAEIGSADNDYSEFKHRYSYFKEVLQRDYPELTNKEIIKFNNIFQRFREIYNWCGHDYLFKVFEWEQLKEKL